MASDDATVQWKETERLGRQWADVRDAKLPKRVRKLCRDPAHDTLQRMAAAEGDDEPAARGDRARVAGGGSDQPFSETPSQTLIARATS